MTLGDVIMNYRSEHGMSMSAFAKAAGISKAYVSMLEKNRTQRGDEPTPSIDVYRSVARAVGQDVDELIRIVDGKISLPKQRSSGAAERYSYSAACEARRERPPIRINREIEPTDDQIRAAFFNGADPNLSEEEQKEMWEAAKSFIQFQIMQKKQKENK